MEWRSLPEILDAEQLIERALHRAAKKRSGKFDSAARKLSSLADNLGAPLGAIVEDFPSLDQLHPFDRDIVNLSVGLDELRQSLGGIDWARKQLQKLGGQFSSKAARARGERALQLQKQGYGRLTSVVRQVSDRLEDTGSAAGGRPGNTAGGDGWRAQRRQVEPGACYLHRPAGGA